MSTYQISCQIGNTDPSAKLGLEIWIDNQQIFNSDHITEKTPLTFDVAEDEADHELRFVMKNKTVAHTQIDLSGNIVTDARLTISDVAFDEIKLGQMFIDQTQYTHDFNGSQPEITDRFYGEMGCNGTVSLQFTTPIYLWLLEHM
jgi:riboflavin synthase